MTANIQKTFSIVMCAYNEEANISFIIDDVFGQAIPDSWHLDKCLIISDSSTDKTDSLIEEKQKLYPKIQSLRHDKRSGKNSSLNEAKSLLDSDYAFIIDCDIRLSDGIFANLLDKAEKGYDLIAGNQQPLTDNNRPSLAAKAELFSCSLIDKIAKIYPFYGFDGKLLALSKKFFNAITLPPDVNEDRYLYLVACRDGLGAIRVKEAVFHFRATQNFRDYLEQRRRNQGLTSATKDIIGNKIFNRESHVKPNILIKAWLASFRERPLGGLAWLAYNAIAKAWFIISYYLIGKKSDQHWNILKSTKNPNQTIKI